MLRRLALALVSALVLAGPATAGDIGVTLGFKAGTLAVKTQSAAPSRVAVTVIDARGNGKGWTLRLAGSGAVTRVTVRCAAGSTCTLPSATLALPAAIGPKATSVLSAASGSGMGAIEIVLTVEGARGPVGVTVSG
jgi:hypothetical protein